MVRKKILKLNRGFTLVELMVVAGIMVVIGAVTVNLLSAILKSSLKATTIQDAKQNGDYAVSVLERAIRNSLDIQNCEQGMSEIEITNPDGSTTIFSFTADNITSSGANLIRGNNYYQVSNSVFDCFLVEQKPSAVSIKFTLEKETTSRRAEERVIVPFQTKVSLRPY